jgi:hypothetical protein
MMTYALGRELGFSDRDYVNGVLEKIKTKERGLRTLVHAIIESPVFVTP